MRTAAFASVGTLVVSAGEDGQVKVWDQKNLKMPTTIVRLRAGINRYVAAPDKNKCSGASRSIVKFTWL